MAAAECVGEAAIARTLTRRAQASSGAAANRGKRGDEPMSIKTKRDRLRLLLIAALALGSSSATLSGRSARSPSSTRPPPPEALSPDVPSGSPVTAKEKGAGQPSGPGPEFAWNGCTGARRPPPKARPAARAAFRVATEWKGEARSQSTVRCCTIGGEEVARGFTILADERGALLGSDTAPNKLALGLDPAGGERQPRRAAWAT